MTETLRIQEKSQLKVQYIIEGETYLWSRARRRILERRDMLLRWMPNMRRKNFG